MKRRHITRLRIQLDDLDKDEREKIASMVGKIIVIIDSEPCLTCGHRRRVQTIRKTDGKQEIIRECLYCICKHHTYANERNT